MPTTQTFKPPPTPLTSTFNPKIVDIARKYGSNKKSWGVVVVYMLVFSIIKWKGSDQKFMTSFLPTQSDCQSERGKHSEREREREKR